MSAEPIRCPSQGCENEIGRLHPLAEGISLLDLGGGLLVSHCRGVCKQCGTTFHFDINDQKLTRLIKSIKAISPEVVRSMEYGARIIREQEAAIREAGLDFDTAHPDPAWPVHKDSQTDGSE